MVYVDIRAEKMLNDIVIRKLSVKHLFRLFF